MKTKTKTKTNRRKETADLTPPKIVSVSPSETIDFAELERLGAEVDRMAERMPDEKPKRVRLPKKAEPIESEGEDGTEPEPEALPYDPEFELMLIHGVGVGVDFCKTNLHMIEPGITWRDNVGKCVSRLLQRIKPVRPGPIGDLFTLAGYVGMWALMGREPTNERATPDTLTDGYDRKRENLQDGGTNQSGPAMFSV